MQKIIILRHAERPPIPNGERGDDIALNEHGINESIRFAKTIDENILSVQSSPIYRCIQVAEIIATQHDYPIENIALCNLLGKPGAFITDANQAWQHWFEKGHDAVNEYHLKGNEQWNGFREFPEAIQLLKNKIFNSFQQKSEGIHIWVTHDTILGAFASRILDNRLNLEDWPNYLGRLEITLTSKKQIKATYYRDFS